jgi:hypothetical protein
VTIVLGEVSQIEPLSRGSLATVSPSFAVEVVFSVKLSLSPVRRLLFPRQKDGVRLADPEFEEANMSTLANRILGSARLDSQSYEEVETDNYANIQAVGVVLFSSVAAAIGTGIKDPASILQVLVVAIASWMIWVLLTLFIGTRLLPGNKTRADFGQVLRTTGFSASPGILRVFGIIPGVGWFIFAGATLWMLLSFVVAVRQALDYTSTGRAIAVCLLGWIIHGVVFFGFVLTAL